MKNLGWWICKTKNKKLNSCLWYSRNYHVFYYLLQGASDVERQKLFLGKAEDYFYLNQVLSWTQCQPFCTQNGQNSMEFWPFWVQLGWYKVTFVHPECSRVNTWNKYEVDPLLFFLTLLSFVFSYIHCENSTCWKADQNHRKNVYYVDAMKYLLTSYTKAKHYIILCIICKMQ